VIFRTLLKGQCHEISTFGFFHQTIPPRALIHGLKPFEYGFEFAEKIDIIVGNVWLPRSDICRRSRFRGLIETSEAADIDCRSRFVGLI
jgi:hypothetical protein